MEKLNDHNYFFDSLTENKEFPVLWLKDNSLEARHESGQKIHETSMLSDDILPIKDYKKGDVVKLVWKDGSTTTYPHAVLHQTASIFANESNRPSEGSRMAWGNEIDHTEISTEYSSLNNREDLLACLNRVVQYGFTLIKDTPLKEDTYKSIVALFGFVRKTNYGSRFRVKTKANIDNLAWTSLGLSPHTDNPYRHPTPSLQLLHCIKNDANGGDSILVDGLNVVNKLKEADPESFALLSETPVTYEFKNETTHLTNTDTVIGMVNGELKHVKFNNRSIQPFMFSLNKTKQYYKAFVKFGSMLNDPSNQLSFKLNAGEAVLFDNERILHGRKSFDQSGDRLFIGCYADIDGLRSKVEMLKKEKA